MGRGGVIYTSGSLLSRRDGAGGIIARHEQANAQRNGQGSSAGNVQLLGRHQQTHGYVGRSLGRNGLDVAHASGYNAGYGVGLYAAGSGSRRFQKGGRGEEER